MSAPTLRVFAALFLVLSVSAGAARAQNEDYFTKQPDEVTFRIDKERSTTEKVVIGSIGGGVVLFGAIGGLFTIDYNNKSDEVSAVGAHTGMIYTEALEDTRKSAIRSRNLAIVGYGLAGASLIGTIVTYIVTEPGTEEVTYGPGGVIEKKIESSTLVAPVEGGAIVGKMWRF